MMFSFIYYVLMDRFKFGMINFREVVRAQGHDMSCGQHFSWQEY
jgi:hypothetical protein